MAEEVLVARRRRFLENISLEYQLRPERSTQLQMELELEEGVHELGVINDQLSQLTALDQEASLVCAKIEGLRTELEEAKRAKKKVKEEAAEAREKATAAAAKVDVAKALTVAAKALTEVKQSEASTPKAERQALKVKANAAAAEV